MCIILWVVEKTPTGSERGPPGLVSLEPNWNVPSQNKDIEYHLNTPRISLEKGRKGLSGRGVGMPYLMFDTQAKHLALGAYIARP